MDIVIIGSGNVATILGRKISAAKHSIVRVIARNRDKGERLAAELNADYSDELKNIAGIAEIYLIAVSDQAIQELQFNLNTELVAHTAGSVAKEVLARHSQNYGVLYPLQTLNARTETIPDFPLLIDANNRDGLEKLMTFGLTLSGHVVEADDVYRRNAHLAAVITGNFVNHLFALVQDYCHNNSVDQRLLLPQIKEVVANFEKGQAALKQTGPAFRNDVETLNRHINMLVEFPELRPIYELMSDSIRRYHIENKG